MLDGCVGLDVEEAVVGIEGSVAELDAGAIAVADEDGASDDGRDVHGEIEPPEGDGGGEALAGNSVVGGLDGSVGEVGEPAVGDVESVGVGLDGFELLGPVGVGVAEVAMDLRGAAPGFVAVRHVCGSDARGGDDLPVE